MKRLNSLILCGLLLLVVAVSGCIDYNKPESGRTEYEFCMDVCLDASNRESVDVVNLCLDTCNLDECVLSTDLKSCCDWWYDIDGMKEFGLGLEDISLDKCRVFFHDNFTAPPKTEMKCENVTKIDYACSTYDSYNTNRTYIKTIAPLGDVHLEGTGCSKKLVKVICADSYTFDGRLHVGYFNYPYDGLDIDNPSRHCSIEVEVNCTVSHTFCSKTVMTRNITFLQCNEVAV